MFMWNILWRTSFIKESKFQWNLNDDFGSDVVFNNYHFLRAKSFGKCTKYTYAFVKSANSMSNFETVVNKYVESFCNNLNYYLSLEVKDTNNYKLKWTIIQSFIYFVAMYTAAIYFVSPYWKHTTKPSKEEWLKHKSLFNSILIKHGVKLKCPKGWWKIISYMLCILPKFK
jgi:hypothetical protein